MANNGIYTDTVWSYGVEFIGTDGQPLALPGDYECEVYRKDDLSAPVFTFTYADGTIDQSQQDSGILRLNATPLQHQPSVTAGSYRLHLKRIDVTDLWAAEGEMLVARPGELQSYIKFGSATDGGSASNYVVGVGSEFISSNLLRVPLAESIPEIGNVGARANKYLKFDENGDPSVVTSAVSGNGNVIPDPLYIGVAGQSNTGGSDGGSGTNWITETGKVYVWVPTSATWEDAATRQGLEPFNLDGSNNPAIHTALAIARQYNITVRLVLFWQGSTELNQWTGGGYNNGVAIPTDRTVSSTNRVQFKKLTDAISAASIPQLHGLLWWQGEADYATPESVYISELEYLVSDVKAQGVSPDATRKFVTVVHGLYTGEDAGLQATRTASLEKFVRLHPDTTGYVPTDDLEGRDDDLVDPDNIINHFTSPAYKIAGERAAGAFLNVWQGGHYLADQRLKSVIIPASGVESEKIGFRTHEVQTITGGTLTLSVDANQMRGETYRFSGTCTIDLDGTANSGLGHAGLHFEYFTLSNSDSLTFNGNGRDIQMLGDGTLSSSITITSNAGRGRVVYEGSRYIIDHNSRLAHAQAVIENGTSTSRRLYSPAELRQAANASIVADEAVSTISTDAGGTITRPTQMVFHTGTLTATRTLNLSSTSAHGQIYVARSGTGAFNLAVRDQASTALLKNLATGQWLIAGWNGTAWALLAFGSL